MSADIALQNDFNGDMFMGGLLILIFIVALFIDKGYIK